MKRKIFSVIAGGSLFLVSIVPALAVEVQVVGNGKGSTNEVTVESSCVHTVSQSSETTGEIELLAAGNSGYNTASGNTGSDVKIKTGNVTNEVKVSIHGGHNVSETPNCCCSNDSLNVVKIKENGKNSENTVDVTTESESATSQESQTQAGVQGAILGNTGGNKAKSNTAKNAKVRTKTGQIKNTVSVKVKGGSNELL